MTETNIETLIRDLVTPLLKHPAALTISQEDGGRYHQYIVNAVLMYFSMGHMMWGWPLPAFFEENHVAMGDRKSVV